MRMQPVFRAMLGSGMAMLLTATLSVAQPAEANALPEGLRHVPTDAVGFVHFRVGDFLKNPIGAPLLQELRKDREAAKGLKKLEQTLGIEAADLESVTLLMLALPDDIPRNLGAEAAGPPKTKERFPNFEMKPKVDFKERKPIEEKKDDTKPDGKESPVRFQERDPGELLQHIDQDSIFLRERGGFSGPLVILTSAKPLDRKKILRTHLFESNRRSFQGPMGEALSVIFLSDRSLMVGAAWELARYSERIARTPAPMAKPMKSALALGANPHVLVAGGQLPADMRYLLASLYGLDLRLLAMFSPLLSTEAGLTLDFDKSLDLTLQFQASNEASAANALQAVKSLRVVAELGLEKSKEGGESGGWKLELENGLAKALADVSIEQKGTAVRAQLKMEVSPAVFKRLTKELVSTLRSSGDRAESSNNLKQIGLAMHNYHSTYNYFPPAGIKSIRDPNGKPLLSWRVAILPYIEQDNLYRQFDLTLPWDDPHNKKLIARMPSIYLVPGVETKDGMTHYRVLVGPGTMFDSGLGRGIRIGDIQDGTSNTMMVIEAAEPTIWTRPDDLTYDPKGPLPKLGVSPDGFNAVFGDGHVQFIRSTTPHETLRALITRNGGEAVQLPD